MSGEGAVRQVTIDRLGHRGDGVAAGPLFVAYALPGEAVTVEVAGERGRLVSIEVPSPERIAPFCPYFGTCGGCAIQHLAEPAYRAWKRSLVVDALLQTGLDIDVAPLVDAHGDGRRRATLHGKGEVVGFAEARSHALVDIASCPILVPPLDAALPAVRAVVRALRGLAKPLDVVVTATGTGVDMDLRGAGKVPEPLRQKLAQLATAHDLARIAIHGDVVVERRAPLVQFGRAAVAPPPGAFLQATEAADRILAALVQAGIGKSRRVADLFCGCGTLGTCPRRDGHRRRL